MAVVVRWAHVDEVDEVDGIGDRLSAGERSRLVAMRRPIDRRQFVGVRRLLRQTVRDAVGCAPDDIELHQVCARCGGPHGRPSVTIRGHDGPHVSMAHSAGFAMVAIAPRPVGVDLEPNAASTDPRTWVRTESVLKATGFGLDVDPQLVGVSDPRSAPRLLTWHGPGRRPVLRMADVEIGWGMVAAVARIGRLRIRLDAAPTRIDAPSRR